MTVKISDATAPARSSKKPAACFPTLAREMDAFAINLGADYSVPPSNEVRRAQHRKIS